MSDLDIIRQRIFDELEKLSNDEIAVILNSIVAELVEKHRIILKSFFK